MPTRRKYFRASDLPGVWTTRSSEAAPSGQLPRNGVVSMVPGARPARESRVPDLRRA